MPDTRAVLCLGRRSLKCEFIFHRWIISLKLSFCDKEFDGLDRYVSNDWMLSYLYFYMFKFYNFILNGEKI